MTCADRLSGPVVRGSVEPNRATCGTFKAAARCIGPESFVINSREAAIKPIVQIIDWRQPSLMEKVMVLIGFMVTSGPRRPPACGKDLHTGSKRRPNGERT
jgi:hypothetical protein